jgi:hypothetical protein
MPQTILRGSRAAGRSRAWIPGPLPRGWLSHGLRVDHQRAAEHLTVLAAAQVARVRGVGLVLVPVCILPSLLSGVTFFKAKTQEE